MKTIFVQIKCQMKQSYEVASRIIELDGVSEVYSTSGHYDLMVKCALEDETDTGLYVTNTLQEVNGIQDTLTIITFNAFAV